jgi:hypothetical protein
MSSSDVPSPLVVVQAEALAQTILSRMDHTDDEDIHRERIASDLAGIRQHRMVGYSRLLCGWCADQWAHDWPCQDVLRYSEGLRRTAAFYGVEVPDA